MGFENSQSKPDQVRRARREGNTEALSRMGKAGAKKRNVSKNRREDLKAALGVSEEELIKGAEQAALERGDLSPEGDETYDPHK